MTSEITLFGEDEVHREVITALIQKIAQEYDLDLHLSWRSASGGRGKVVEAFRKFLHGLKRQEESRPDLVVVATDANCTGLNERVREFQGLGEPVPVVLAIPDPHVERWLLLDGAAFKAVFGRGCDAPDLKCIRNRYKQRLIDEVLSAGVELPLGDVEFARSVVMNMDIDRVARSDESFARFVGALRAAFDRRRSSR